MRFFVGIFQPNHARHFDSVFMSVNILRRRKGSFVVGDWILDSGAFSTIQKYGGYPHPVSEYVDQIRRWNRNGNLLAAVTQDYMCEPFMLKITGLTVAEHQRLTIDRFDTLRVAIARAGIDCYLMPVLQGYHPDEYLDHIRQYGERLKWNDWVGVGSICKRNGSPRKILDILIAIKTERPDLRLHGFGIKTSSLRNGTIRRLLESADSMAWSFAARRNHTGANDYRNAIRFEQEINKRKMYQSHLIEVLIP